MNRFEPPPLPDQTRPAQEPVNPYASPTAGGPVAPSQGYGSAPGYDQPGGYGAAPQTPWGLPASHVHPQGTTVLLLGIASLVLLPILGPVAWVMGRRAIKEVDAAPHPTSNRSTLVVGMVLGVISTAFLVLAALALAAILVLAVMLGSSAPTV